VPYNSETNYLADLGEYKRVALRREQNHYDYLQELGVEDLEQQRRILMVPLSQIGQPTMAEIMYRVSQ
jgi:hypothetical protein